MARFIDAADLPVSAEQAFDYLADFSRTVEWDPGVSAATMLTDGPPRKGTRFSVLIRFLGQDVHLEYEIEVYERPCRLVLLGTNDALISRDVITLSPTPAGARLTYDASVDLVGIRRLADPLLNLLFQQIGRLAMRGLRGRLAVNPIDPSETDSPADAALARPVAISYSKGASE